VWDGQALVLVPERPAVAAPGQAAVVYDGARVVAGGVIAAH
jgi:tRNA-uridine 2-sulfurtransferase